LEGSGRSGHSQASQSFSGSFSGLPEGQGDYRAKQGNQGDLIKVILLDRSCKGLERLEFFRGGCKCLSLKGVLIHHRKAESNNNLRKAFQSLENIKKLSFLAITGGYKEKRLNPWYH